MRGAGTVQVFVDVDIADVLDEIDDKDLLAEVKARGLSVRPSSSNPHTASNPLAQWEDLCTEIRRTAEAGDWRHLDILLLRLRPDLPPIKAAAAPALPISTPAGARH